MLAVGQVAQGLYPRLLKRIPEVADPAFRDGVKIKLQRCDHGGKTSATDELSFVDGQTTCSHRQPCMTGAASGEDYLEHRRNVVAWLARLRPWKSLD
ncbi:hypothetical protein Rhe02_38630 [Rhizocola hellebori]|uniref:Uncharacterized protein n=1 Tax=Rhizocola hellebori TaxID=1392758 RepID=A0A8J3Q9W6_9ACTN|nr:hypothetical protein Rhe02_38630 [Rhizocola hellebori]